jgi:hypothetical protein
MHQPESGTTKRSGISLLGDRRTTRVLPLSIDLPWLGEIDLDPSQVGPLVEHATGEHQFIIEPQALEASSQLNPGVERIGHAGQSWKLAIGVS